MRGLARRLLARWFAWQERRRAKWKPTEDPKWWLKYNESDKQWKRRLRPPFMRKGLSWQLFLATSAGIMLVMYVLQRVGAASSGGTLFVSSGATLFFLALVNTTERYEVWEIEYYLSNHARSIPLIVFLATFSVGFFFLNHPGTEKFYEVAASVIPVFLLALAIEQHSIVRIARVPAWQMVYTTTILAALGIGEAAALAAIDTDRQGPLLWSLVAAALVSGFSGLLVLGVIAAGSVGGTPPE